MPAIAGFSLGQICLAITAQFERTKNQALGEISAQLSGSDVAADRLAIAVWHEARLLRS